MCDCKWMDIETAPKDEMVLLYLSGEGYHGPRICNTAVGVLTSRGWYTHCDGAGGVVSAPPSHWMKLPEPPTTQSDS